MLIAPADVDADEDLHGRRTASYKVWCSTGYWNVFFLLFRPVLYTLDTPKRQRKAEEGQRNNVISAVENMSATSSVAQPRNVEAVA